MNELEYWKKRCELAEKFIDESPGDPDITDSQITAYREWQDFKKIVNLEIDDINRHDSLFQHYDQEKKFFKPK
jgi:hypothetical protein